MKISLVFLLCSSLHLNAQLSRLDSLKKNITTSASASGKLQATLQFCDGWESYSPDTLYKYALMASQQAIAKKNNDAILLSDYYMAAYLFQKNKLDTALAAIDAVVKRAQKTMPYNKTSVKFWLLRGNILQRTSHYDEVLKQDLSLITLAELHHDTIGIIRFNTGIGNVNTRLKKDAEALKWHYKALALMTNNEFRRECSFVYVNIAIVYYHLAVLNDTKQNEDSIELNIQKAIRYAREGNNLTNLANSLSMYGIVLAEYKKLQPAEAALTEALRIRKEIGDVYYEIADMLALASFYENSNNNAKAIDICLRALDITKKNSTDFSSLNSIYSLLGEIYSNDGNYKKYSEVLTEKMHLLDSVYKMNTAEAVTEMEAKYEVQKKQNTIIQQQYDLTRKSYFVYGSLLLLLLGVFFSIILFNQNKKKQQLKLQMMHEEEQRMSAIAIEQAQESERNRIAAELHDNLGSQLSYISSNMDFIIDAPKQISDEEKNTRLVHLNQATKNTITDLRETIWALKKDAVEIEALADRLKLYAQNQLSHKVNMKLDVEEKLDVKIILSPAEALNIFRIFQEAINNAAKYSNATQLLLSFTADAPGRYSIFLKDDGVGFDLKVIHRDHYGLENMKERAEKIQVSLEITSIRNIGTKVLLSKNI